MSLLSNSVYSYVITYNPNVLTRPYQYLTTKALIELHHITCVSLDISVLIVRFGDRARACRVDTHQKQTSCPSTLDYLTNCLITMCQTMDYPYQWG